MTDPLISTCLLGVAAVCLWLARRIPVAPPPGHTGRAQPPGLSIPPAGNPGDREAAHLLVASGAVRRAP